MLPLGLLEHQFMHALNHLELSKNVASLERGLEVGSFDKSSVMLMQPFYRAIWSSKVFTQTSYFTL